MSHDRGQTHTNTGLRSGSTKVSQDCDATSSESLLLQIKVLEGKINVILKITTNKNLPNIYSFDHIHQKLHTVADMFLLNCAELMEICKSLHNCVWYNRTDAGQVPFLSPYNINKGDEGTSGQSTQLICHLMEVYENAKIESSNTSKMD